ncbi:glycerate kinase [Vibrio cholerae]|nr:glycerate kinase [Vibrio cholerae]
MGPQGKRVEAFYGILGDNQTAVIEMAAAHPTDWRRFTRVDPHQFTRFRPKVTALRYLGGL